MKSSDFEDGDLTVILILVIESREIVIKSSQWRRSGREVEEKQWSSGEGASDAQTVGFLPLWHHRRHHNSYHYHHHLDHNQQQC